MTSFAHVTHPTQHPGVERAQRVARSFREGIAGFDGARATATLLLAAIVAALMAVANQVVQTWTEGHLLAAWIVLWTVAFAALALLASPVRRASAKLRNAYSAWSARRAQAAQDEKYWQAALSDARIMADISRAMSAAAVRDIKAYY